MFSYPSFQNSEMSEFYIATYGPNGWDKFLAMDTALVSNGQSELHYWEHGL